MQLEHSFTVPVGIDEAWRILLDIDRIGPCMPGAVIESVDGDDFTGSVKVKLGPINLTYKGRASFVEKDEATHRAVIDARGRDARGNGTAAAKVTAVLTGSGTSTTVQVNTDLDITGKPAQFGRGVMVDVGNKLIGQFSNNLAATLSEDAGRGASTTDDAADSAGAPVTSTSASAGSPSGSPAKAAKATKATDETRPKPARAAAAAAAAAAASGPVPDVADELAAAAAEGVAPQPVSGSDAGSDAGSNGSASSSSSASAANSSEANRPNSPQRRPEHEVEPIDLIESAGPAVAKRLAPIAVALVVVLLAVRKVRKRD